MRLLLILALCLFTFSVLSKQQPIQASNNVVIINNVNIVDVANNRIDKNQFVLIKGDKIKQLSATKPKLTAGAIEVDGQGKYLMAGLIDMHVHVFRSEEHTSELQSRL